MYIHEFSKKDLNREEKIARALDRGVNVGKAAAGGAVAGSIGGPVGIAAGAAAAGVAQTKLRRVSDKQDKDRKPIQAAATRSVLPAAGGILVGRALEKSKRVKKMTNRIKAGGRLLRKKLKHLEGKIDTHNFGRKDQQKDSQGRYADNYEPSRKNVPRYVDSDIYRPDAVPGSPESEKLKRDTRRPIEVPEVRGAVVNKAKKINKWGGRGARAARDIGDVVTGKPRRKDAAGRNKKREWEKSYAKNAIGTAATAGLLFAGNNHLRKNPRLRRKIDSSVERLKRKAGQKLLKGSEAIGFESLTPGMIELDSVSVRDKSGRQVFRVEDARGNSARIHQGDKPKRQRRKKRWNEKIENERKLWGAGVVAAAGGGALVAVKGKEAAKAAGDTKLGKAAKRSKLGKAVIQKVAERQSGRLAMAKRIARATSRSLN